MRDALKASGYGWRRPTVRPPLCDADAPVLATCWFLAWASAACGST